MAQWRQELTGGRPLALLDQDRVDWPAVNKAVVAGWSLSALDWIKAFAWKAEAGEHQQ